MICLSGQHEMTSDFTGFRNFFTLNFFAKPIYNAYVLAGKLYDGLLGAACDNKKIYTVPTKDKNGNMAVLISYSEQRFEEDIEDLSETLMLDENIIGKKVTVWCIDKDTTNPYSKWKKLGEPVMTGETIKTLREESKLRPISEFVAEKNSFELKLTANCVYLVEIV